MRTIPRLVPIVASLALLAGCRDRADTNATASADSAFARDIALAQQQAPPQTVFNDAPIGGSTAAAPEAAAPAPPPMRVPKPTPAPRRESPPAPVARTPRPTTPEPAPVERAPEAAPTAAPAQAPAAGVIGVGTRVGLTMNDRSCTSALVGDKFTATTSSTTVGINGAVIPAGSTVVLEVTSVERGDPVETSRIHFHVRAIDVNGESYPGEGEVTTLSQMETERVAGGTSDRTKVIGGAVAGAVLGRIFGGGTKGTVIGAAAGAAAGTAVANRTQNMRGCLAVGSSLQLTLSRDIVMRRDGKL
jgi:hypothetical protein